MNYFEEKVLLGLNACNIHPEKESCSLKIGVAVSGGADSVSLLLALSNIAKVYPIQLKVITINHYIRADEETCKDAAFVMALCCKLKKQGFPVDSCLVEFEKGSVKALCEEKKTGIEDAARTLRYKAFEAFIKSEKLNCLCLAHNQNDQLETLLMRFLQGSSVEHCQGIPLVREKYIRPLLNISRNEIEEYLREKKQDYCTDSTNSDTKYLRNRIRNKLMPVLNENFPGWKKAVLNGGKKACEDSLIISKNVNQYSSLALVSEDDSICFCLKEFLELEKGIQRRLLLDALNHVCKREGENRIPFVFINEVLDLVNGSEKTFKKTLNQVEIIKKNDMLFVKKSENLNTDLVFSVIIQRDGIFEFPFGTLEILTKNQNNRFVNINGTVSECCFSYPIRVRNMAQDDYILSASNSLKKVSVILNDWKVPGEKRNLVPVIQELDSAEQPLVCILSKFLGFKDWILRK